MRVGLYFRWIVTRALSLFVFAHQKSASATSTAALSVNEAAEGSQQQNEIP